MSPVELVLRPGLREQLTLPYTYSTLLPRGRLSHPLLLRPPLHFYHGECSTTPPLFTSNMETPWTAGELSILSNRQLINDARTGELKRVSISHVKKQWLVDTIVSAGYTKAGNAHRRLIKGLIPAGSVTVKVYLEDSIDWQQRRHILVRFTLPVADFFGCRSNQCRISTACLLRGIQIWIQSHYGSFNPTVRVGARDEVHPMFVEYFAQCPVNEMKTAALAFDRLTVKPFDGVGIVLETGDARPTDEHEDDILDSEEDHHRVAHHHVLELKPTDKPLEIARQRDIANITWLRSRICAKAAYSDFQALRYRVLPNSSIPQYWGFVVEVLAEYTRVRNPNTNMRIRRTTISKALEIGPTWIREIEEGYRLLQAHLSEDAVQARLNDKECHGGTKGMLLYLRNL
ncbi:hypothetical protein BDZ89DRAFT_1161277 [Hymenopellis radicata]|nr:hypothetical protein BDZ89DRAFT_1161277 [Hymenopellis radicata]